ncbi:MAG: ion transporter [Bacteroidales bacterium]|nr:ion transporter [Bacteroidales bacterium]
MKLFDNLKGQFQRLYRWFLSVNWIKVGRNVIDFIGRLMHKLLFGILLPKRYRNVSKRRIFEVIFKSDTPAGKKFDIWLLILIILNIAVLITDSLFGSTSTLIDKAQLKWSFILIKMLEWGFTIFFTFEYYLRIYCLKHPKKYVFSFWGIIDFISIFPSYLSLFWSVGQALTVFRLLRVMRIFRIFKMIRFQQEARFLLTAMKNSAVKILIFMLFVLVAAVILGTMMYSFEGGKNPDFDSVLTGIYWAVVTITTVGYGDVAPVTAAGRLLAVIVMLLGYAIIAVPTGIVAGETISEHRRQLRRRVNALEREYDDEEDEAISN